MSGKRANCVVSMSHRYFQHYGLGKTDATVYFDNASGQNKNNVVLWYRLRRVLTGLHNSIEYSKMIAGHTRLALWPVESKMEIFRCRDHVRHSYHGGTVIRSGHNVPQLVKDQNKPVIFLSVKDFLVTVFLNL